MIGIVTRISTSPLREAAVPCMGPLAAVAGVVGAVASVASAGMGLYGSIVSAKGQQQAAGAQAGVKESEALQREQQAQEARAASQRQALESQRKGELAQSTLQARAAASGAGAADETVIGLGEDLAGRSEYQSLMDMYQGENRARGYQDAANMARLEADATLKAGQTKAQGTLLSGAGSFVSGMGDAFSKASKINFG